MFEMGVSTTMTATRRLEEALVARSGPCPSRLIPGDVLLGPVQYFGIMTNPST